MPSTTIYSIVPVSQIEYDIRRCFIIVGNSTSVQCYIPVNTHTKVRVSSLNIIGRPYSLINCLLHSFEYSNLRLYCSKPVDTITNDIMAVITTNSNTRFTVITADIGNINSDTKYCVVPIYDFSSLNCLLESSATLSHSVCCYLNIARNTLFDVLNINVGLETGFAVKSIVEGELYDDLSCCIITHTKRSDRGALIHQAIEADLVSEIKCCLPRIVGDSLEYVALEILLGKRFIDTCKGVVTVPQHNYTDLYCSLSYVLDGICKWTRFTDREHIYIRFSNLGNSKVGKAILQDNNTMVESTQIEQIGSLWQVRFDKKEELNSNYVIVINIEPESKILVLDRSSGEFTL